MTCDILRGMLNCAQRHSPSSQPKHHSDPFSHFCKADGRASLYFTVGRISPLPFKIASSHERIGTPSNIIPWAHPSPQPKRHLDWFNHFAWFTTVTDRRTDVATRSVATAGAVMRPDIWPAGIVDDVSVLCTVEPLYDWTGRPVSDQEFQMLRHYQITFRHLITVFDDFCSHSSTATESGEHI